MKKMRKFLCILAILAMMVGMFAGCGAKEEAAAPSEAPAEAPAEEAADAPAEEAATELLPGIEDPEVDAALREAASHYVYSELVKKEETCTSGLISPMFESRAHINKGIPADAGSYKPEDIKLGMQVYMLDNDWFVSIVEGAEAAAEELGIELVVLSAGGTEEGTLSTVESLITQGCQGIVFNGIGLDVNKNIANMCADAGVMGVGAGIVAPADSGALTSMVMNNFWSGVEVGKVAGESLKGEHVVFAHSLSYWGESNAESRSAGVTAGLFMYRSEELGLGYDEMDCVQKAVEFWQEVRQNGKASSEEFDVEIVYVGESENTEAGGQQTAEYAFTARPDINLFTCNNDFEAIGVCIGAENMGIKLGEDGCRVVAVSDGNIKFLERIMDGTALATVDSCAFGDGYNCVKVMYDVLVNGYDANNLPEVTSPPYEAITIDNVEEYYVPGQILPASGPFDIISIPEYNQQQAAKLG